MTFYDKDKLEAAQARVRANATPEQLKTMDMVQAAIDEENRDLDARFSAETKLRAWAGELCGFELTVSEMETFKDKAKEAKAGSLFYIYDQRGKGKSALIYKTAFGTLDRADRYINTLERTVIDITNNSQFTALTFRGLMKLAFRRLLTRSK